MAKGNYDDPIFYTVTDGNNTSYSYNSGLVDITTQRIVHVTDVGISTRVNAFDTSLETTQVSGAVWSVSASQTGAWAVTLVEGAQASVAATQVGAWTVSLVEGSQASVSVSTVATTLDIKQVSGSIDSVSIVSNIASLDTVQVSGSVDSVVVNSFVTSIEEKQVSGSVHSVFVTGSSGTTAVVGDNLAGVADSGEAPIKSGGIARSTNPTKVSDGNRVSMSMDLVGRQLIWPVQVRELLQTAYLSKSTTVGTETTLLAGIASTFLDLVSLTCTNNSSAAVSVDIRSETLAGIMYTVTIPATGSIQMNFTPPIPQNVAAGTWTVDLPDISGTICTFSALFAKNV